MNLKSFCKHEKKRAIIEEEYTLCGLRHRIGGPAYWRFGDFDVKFYLFGTILSPGAYKKIMTETGFTEEDQYDKEKLLRLAGYLLSTRAKRKPIWRDRISEVLQGLGIDPDAKTLKSLEAAGRIV